jgi:hypothetical protein
LINALRESLIIDEQVELMAPHNWEDRLTQLQKTADKRNEQIMYVLEKIRDWQKKYQPYLDEIKKDHDKLETVLKKKNNGELSEKKGNN